MFSMTGMTPGSTDTGCINVTYTGSLPSLVRLYGTTTGTGLDTYLDLVVTRGTIPSPSFDSCSGFVADSTDYQGDGAGVIFDDTMAAYADTWTAGRLDPRTATVQEAWTTGETHAYKFVVTLQNNPSAANKTASQTFSWEARNTTAYSEVVRSDQPASYWRLDEAAGTSAADSAGSATGTYTNGPALNQTSGVKDAGAGVTFDGVNDWIDAGNVYGFTGTASFSVEAWIRPTAATTQYRRFVSKENASGHGWQLNLKPTTDAPANRVAILRRDATSYEQATSTTALPTTSWSHVVATYNGSSLCIYVNSSLEATGTSSRSLPAHTNPLRLGSASYSGANDLYGGSLDEVAIYSTALSAAQVTEHYNAGKR
jgi:hypothetical protein